MQASRIGAVVSFAILSFAPLAGCGRAPIGEPGVGAVQRFERGDPLFVVGTTNPLLSIRTYLCTSCTREDFESLRLPRSLERRPVWTLTARTAEVRALPSDGGFAGFVDAAGNCFQRDARSLAPVYLGGATFPCGPPFLSRFCGLVVRLESDRTLVYGAGERVHELRNGEDRYILYATTEEMAADRGDGKGLEALVLPPGWVHETRVLDEDLVVESGGLLDAYSDVRHNLWQKLKREG